MVLKLGFIWHKTVNSICEQFLFAKKKIFCYVLDCSHFVSPPVIGMVGVIGAS